MIQTLIQNWWLLALCGAFDGILSFIYLVMQDHDGSLTLRKYAVKGTIVLLGRLTLAAGVCTMAAGVRRSTSGKCWLLVLNGLALSALGLVFNGIFGFRISLRTIALLIVLMAVSIGILELIAARSLRLRRRVADRWFLGMAGVGSVGFAIVFLALAFRWIKLQPGSHLDFIWFGSYFVFSAICMLVFSLRLHSPGVFQPGRWESLPPWGNPGHAH